MNLIRRTFSATCMIAFGVFIFENHITIGTCYRLWRAPNSMLCDFGDFGDRIVRVSVTSVIVLFAILVTSDFRFLWTLVTSVIVVFATSVISSQSETLWGYYSLLNPVSR